MKTYIVICIVAIAILGFAVYSGSLDNKFVWDDHLLVTDNGLIRSWENIPRIMTENVGYGPGGSFILYRPVQILSYLVDHSVWRLDVRGYHLTSIILHILTALALFWFILTLFKDRALSFFTALLFIAHPVHTEAVAYISGRADILAGLFILVTLTFYIRGMFTAAVSAYCLALFSKEYSIIAPVLILLYHFIFRVRIKSPSRIWLYGLITGLYVMLRFAVSESFLGSLSFAHSIAERVPGFFVAVSNYARILLVPSDLRMEYGNPLFDFSDPRSVYGILITAALSIIWFKCRENRIIRFAVPWFFLTILPVSNIYPMNAYMAEHWLYLPSIGFFLVLAGGINHIYKTARYRPAAILILGAVLVYYSYLTVNQNFYWRDPVEFYKRTIRYAPESARLYGNLGTEYSNSGRGPDAIASYRKAIFIEPSYAVAYNNLGTEYNNAGDLDKAKRFYKKAIALSPRYAKPHYSLGMLYASMGKIEKAIASYEKAIELNPSYSEAYNNLAVLHNLAGDREAALTAYSNALKADPSNVDIYNCIGNICSSLGRHEEASVYYKKAIKIDPASAEAYNNLGTELGLSGRTGEAIEMFEKARRIDPDKAIYIHNLDLAREAAGR